MYLYWLLFFFFKQKTAYEMRISDWSSDVCSSDLEPVVARQRASEAGWAPGRRSHQVAAWHAGPGEIAADVISRQCFELELRFGFGAVGQRYKSQAAAAQVPAAIAAAGVQAERFGRACGVRGPFEDHLGIARPDALAAGLAARIVGDADVAQRAAVEIGRAHV